MSSKRSLSIILSGSVLAIGAAAQAQSYDPTAPIYAPSSPTVYGPPPTVHETSIRFGEDFMPAPTNAFELSFSAGYSHASGDVTRGLSFDSVGDDSAAFELQLGWRVSPNLALGVYGSVATFQRGEGTLPGTQVARLSGGLEATWHFSPYKAFDPWIQLGTGWHAFFVDPAHSDGVVYQGLDLARVQVGTDFRINPRVAIAPVIGVELSTFLRAYHEDDDFYHDDLDARLSVFFFAGFSGRFDFGGYDAAPRTITLASR